MPKVHQDIQYISTHGQLMY